MFKPIAAALAFALACAPALAQTKPGKFTLIGVEGAVERFAPGDPEVVRALDITRHIGGVVCGKGFEQDADQVMDNSSVFEWLWSMHQIAPQELGNARGEDTLGERLGSIKCDAAKLPQMPGFDPSAGGDVWKQGRAAYKSLKASEKAAIELGYDSSARHAALTRAAHLMAASVHLALSHELRQEGVVASRVESSAPSEARAEANFLLNMAQGTLSDYEEKEARNVGK